MEIAHEERRIESWRRQKEIYKTKRYRDKVEDHIQFSLKEISELKRLDRFRKRLNL